MAVTPSTDLRLIKCPLTIDNKNQLTFSSSSSQETYFKSLPHTDELDNLTYQRKDSIIRYPAHIDNIIQYNYVMYRNDNYSNKWFYAFIENMTYVNDNRTDIKIKTDSFQTWQFDIIYKKSFVVREHVNDDTIGKHTVEEGLDVGEVRENDSFEYENLGNLFYLAIETSYLPEEGSVNDLNPLSNEGISFSGVTQYNSNFFGNRVVIFPTTGLNYYSNINYFLYRINWDGHIGDIRNMYIVPQKLIPNTSINYKSAYYKIPTQEQHQFTWGEITPSQLPTYDNITIKDYYNFDDYNPKNNKCYCYPTNYLYVTNNVGSYNIYKYEDFYNHEKDIIIFNLILSLQVGVSGRLIPEFYKNIEKNLDESLPLAKFPTCSWSGDTFTNWLTQQGVNEITNFVGTVGVETAGLGVAQEEPSLPFLNSASKGKEIIGHLREAVLKPQIQGGQNTGDVTWADLNNTFKFIHMRAKKEFLQIIDDYYNRFGYKVIEVKTPNITGRRNWNYVETENINLTGNFPQEDLQEIKNMFNRGLTLWHNPSTYLDYSQDNSII